MKKISILFFLFCFCNSFSLFATELDNQETLDSLKHRIELLEQKQSAWEKYRQYLPTISGYIQTGYNYNSYGDGLSTFMVKRMRLIVGGNITSKGQYKIQLEAFNGVNVGSRWEKQKIIQILDAYGQYNFNDAVQLRAGQFSTPAGYENYIISPLTNVTIDYASICSRMVMRNAVGHNYSDFGRDLGLMLLGNLFKSASGNFHYLQYNLALTNGHLPTVNDNNKSKDIIAALTIWPVSKFNFKIAYNWGEYTPDSFSGNIDNNSYPWNTVAGKKYIPLHRFIAGAWYNNPQGWYLRTEYGHLSSTYNNVKLVQESAFYIVCAYQFKKWIPVLRYDWYHDNINKSGADNRHRGLIGCTFIANNHIKIQLNYQLSHYDRLAAMAHNGSKRNSSELLLMGLFSF